MNTPKLIKIKYVLFFIFIQSVLFNTTNGQEVEKVISLDKHKIEAVIDTVISSFEKHYVYPEKTVMIKKGISENFKKGNYNNVKYLNELVELLETDLYQITKDHHIGFSIVNKKDSNKQKNKVSLNSEKKSQLAKKNFYFLKMEILPGNIGYLRFDRFSDATHASKTAIAAMCFLENTDAIILDLRYNYGGNNIMGNLLASYFFEEGTLLGSLYFPGNDSIRQSWTHAVPGKKLIKTKLYILTSSQTASAAEAFSCTMQAHQRAIVIGETTKGASHWRNYYYYPEFDLEIKMPIARPIERDWEGKGISPNIEIMEHKALEKSYIIALQELMSRSENENIKEDFEWYLEIAGMKLKKNDKKLEEYGGIYGKNQLIIYRGGNLYWNQSNEEDFVLLPFAEDAFVFSDSEDYIIQFVRDETNKINGYQFLTKNQKESPIRYKVENSKVK